MSCNAFRFNSEFRYYGGDDVDLESRGARSTSMIGLLQRVVSASVAVDGKTVAAVGAGIVALVAFVREDSEHNADRLLQRMLGYRVFADDQGRMNLSVRETGGGMLLVPQFTLAADTHKGMRASFTPAADPDIGRRLFDYLVEQARNSYSNVQAGVFGADMQVALINDGPVTFWLTA